MSRVRVVLVVLVCSLACWTVTLAATDPSAAWRALKADGAGRAVKQTKVHFSHLDLEINDGVVVVVRNATGDAAGFQFAGHGVWHYRVEDQEVRLLYRENAARVSQGLEVGQNVVGDKFTTATVLFARPIFQELWDGDAPREAAAEALASEFQKTLELMDAAQENFDHMAAEVRLGDVPEQQYVYAELDGGNGGRIGYGCDSTRVGREVLHGFERTDRGRYAKRICFERIAGFAARTSWVLDDADIALDTANNENGTILSTLTLRTLVPGQRLFAFALLNHRDRRSYTWRTTENVLTVTRVVDDSGNELPFSHRYHEILVDTGRQLAQNTTIKLRFETSGDVLTNPSGRRGDNYVDLFFVPWFPQPIGSMQTRMSFSLALRTKKPFMPVASGDTVSLVEDGDFWVLRTRSDVRAWLIAAFAGKYLTSEVKGERWTVHANGYSVGDKNDRERIAHVAAQFLEIYEKMLGPYPYRELDVVEVPTLAYFGISPSGLIILTSRFFQPQAFKFQREQALLTHEFASFYDEYFSNRGLNAVLAHEIAHQWFGHEAWPQSIEDTWLNESCAEYMAGLAIGVATQGANLNKARVKDFSGMLDDWRSRSDMIKENYSITASSLANGGSAFEYRQYLLYNRGPLVLHMLRSLVGDERFLAIMRQYLGDAKYSARTTDDFANAATKVLGTDMHWFFNQWFREPGIPAIKVQQTVDGSGAAPVLKVQLSQPVQGFKKIHIPFVLTFPDGHREVRLAFQEQPRQEFSFPLKASPSKIEVDPGRNNLAKYE